MFLCEPLTRARCCGGEALVHNRWIERCGPALQPMSTTRRDPVDGQRARALAYHDVVALIACFLACPAGSIMEWKSAMVLPCHLTEIRGRALGIALASHARLLHSDTDDARLKDAVFPRGLQATPAV